MSFSRKEIVDSYVTKVGSGSLDYSQIAAELKAKGIPQEESTVLLRRIDRDLLRKAEMEKRRQSGKNMIWVGLGIAVIGIVYTVLSYLRVYETGGSYLLFYGPILSGIGIAVLGKLRMG